MAITTGFEAEKVNDSINSLINCYNNLIRITFTEFEDNFIATLATSWASQDAVDAYKTFKQNEDNLNRSIRDSYGNYIKTMNDAGKMWATGTNTSTYRSVLFNPTIEELDSEGLHENIGGNRGVDDAGCEAALSILQDLSTKAHTILDDTKKSVLDSGFIGGNQQEAINNSIDKIKRKIESNYNEIVVIINKSVRETKERYGSLARTVTSKISEES